MRERRSLLFFSFRSPPSLSLSFRERNGRRRGSRRRQQPRRRQCSCLLYINIRNIWWRRGRRRRPRGSCCCCCCCCFGTGDRRRCRRFNRIVIFESRCTQTLRISVGVDDRGAFCYLRAGGTERVLGSGGPGPGLLRCVFKQSCLSCFFFISLDLSKNLSALFPKPLFSPPPRAPRGRRARARSTMKTIASHGAMKITAKKAATSSLLVLRCCS